MTASPQAGPFSHFQKKYPAVSPIAVAAQSVVISSACPSMVGSKHHRVSEIRPAPLLPHRSLDQKKQVSAPLLKNTLRSGERMVEVTDDGKEALTLFRVLRRFGEFATLVEAKPVTGRTHQIRVHARHAGHSIAGDSKYGDEEFTREIRDLGGKRLFLHAYTLKVPLPDGGELSLEAPVDEMWARTLERLGE